ncbi:dethiobiotin synthase [Magnetovibrio blakemorei]|uniref:ATP-dependent dethiobiotin synthetase BioD n=1 Tax=Magnetovibrio blakemorei TaxID=28181 RepID=A0A1E5Q5W6_9PROT|nr:dethiobiotin synthase [Magnetovibrio blakemorei]OEJ65352.1 dethiobiotin synthase [Magnetovibrio blakemorei]
MMKSLIVTGTDTGVGKTVVAAMLTLGLDGVYYKPTQSGSADGTDRDTIQNLTGLGDERILENGITLSQPLSPHRAAELDGVEIDLNALTPPPQTGRPLIIEGAGGLLVPVNRDTLFIDLFARWQHPVVLVSRTGLGTINHTLLSLEALRHRNIDVLGVVFVGDENADTICTIADMGRVKVLGRVPLMDDMNAAHLTHIFETHFRRADFEGDA